MATLGEIRIGKQISSRNSKLKDVESSIACKLRYKCKINYDRVCSHILTNLRNGGKIERSLTEDWEDLRNC